jgi:hypothetical protein
MARMARFSPVKLAASALGLAIASSLFSAAPASADQRNFSMVNDSEGIITELYVSSIGTGSWEEDILGIDVLGSGNSTNVNFSSGASGRCRYDIKVVEADGTEEFLSNVDLCTTLEVIYTDKGLVAR